MAKLTKANLEKQALNNLTDELAPLILKANSLLKTINKNKELPQEVDLLISIILKYQIYFKEIQVIKKHFPETRGVKRDEEINDALMKTLADLWCKKGNIFIPKLKNYISAVDAYTPIQISEEKCKQFLSEIKNSITSKKLENIAIERYARSTK